MVREGGVLCKSKGQMVHDSPSNCPWGDKDPGSAVAIVRPPYQAPDSRYVGRIRTVEGPSPLQGLPDEAVPKRPLACSRQLDYELHTASSTRLTNVARRYESLEYNSVGA